MKSVLKEALGRALARCSPALAGAVANGDPHALASRRGRLIRHAQLQQAVRTRNWTGLRRGLTTYWQGTPGDQFYDAYPERFDQWFLQHHYPLVNALCAEAVRGSYTRLYEIGCGNGRVLAHLAEQMPDITQFTGLDVNPSIIERNRATYAALPRLSFACADAAEWLPAHAQSGSILLTYGGVLEYFAPDELQHLFRLWADRFAPSTVALVEPLDPAFDASNETTSRAGGLECSFSHPYRRMLEAAGFTIRFEQEVRIEHRWIMLLATRASAGQP
ncbi:MAG TPA: methyltransferase domain-containing protein [Kiritimatiellia bacterium]|nr:methyltransferase domain-containing protein [Kiritimatiellia bacterium]